MNDLVNPFTGEISPLAAYRNHPNDASLSPDRTREVTIATTYDDGGMLLFPESGSYTPYNLRMSVLSVAWSSDSSVFAASVFNSERGRGIFLFDREGQIRIDNIYLDAIGLGRFSYDDHYLTLLQSVDFYTRRLMVADMLNQTITDTCIEYSSHFWSPISPQIALISSGDGQSPVQILDLERWQLFTVAYHEGRIIGWREDPE